MLFFTADQHFSDPITFNIERRPFKNVFQCDKFMLKRLNKVAKKTDTIYFIGDFFDCDGPEFTSWRDTAAKYVKKIKAQKILIIGNNEQRIIKYFYNNNFEAFKKWCLDLGFLDVLQNATVSFNGNTYFLTHKPVDFKPDMITLFGHMHRDSGMYKSFGINLSASLHYFLPLSESDIEYWVSRYPTYVLDDDYKIF